MSQLFLKFLSTSHWRSASPLIPWMPSSYCLRQRLKLLVRCINLQLWL